MSGLTAWLVVMAWFVPVMLLWLTHRELEKSRKEIESLRRNVGALYDLLERNLPEIRNGISIASDASFQIARSKGLAKSWSDD